jgi:transcriptional regulator with XRE-family HTH domain
MLQWCKNVGMRHSSGKHNVARLRVKLNEFEKLDQEQFAKLIGCSVWKLRNIETGRTPLGELLARKICDETGIALEWLLENDLKAPLVANASPVIRDRRGRFTLAAMKRAVLMRKRGVPFTIEAYKSTRLERDLGVPVERKTLYRDLGGLYATVFYAWLRAIFATEDADVAIWKTGKFLEQLASEHAHSRDVVPTPRLEVAALRDHKLLGQQVKIGIRLAEKYARDWRRSSRPRSR